MYKKSVHKLYTLINGNKLGIAHRKQQKLQKVILFSSTLTHMGTKFRHKKTKSPWGSRAQWRFHDPSLCRFDTISECDGRTDGRTPGRRLRRAKHCCRT